MRKSSKVAIVTLAAVFTTGLGIFATNTFANDASRGSMGQKTKLSRQEIHELKCNTGVYIIKDVGRFERTTQVDLPEEEIAYSFDDATVKTKIVISSEYCGTFIRIGDA
ncbi:hypothetical protein J2T17_007138 [Paenibacillus mucilaginosus]|uniref:hypothetical protein n=1 Tax=Paenibacillus mucilaginosus TaxID=61624 RepID=UPI003D25BEA5